MHCSKGVQPVPKAVMGKAKFWPWGSETPERISMKLGIYNHVAGMPTHANPCGAATTWVVWANTWNNTCCCFLGIPFLFFCLILRLALSPHKWTDFDDLYVIRGCAFWVSFILLTILGVKSHKNPYFGAWIGIFKLNAQNIKICILSKLLRRLQPNFAQSQRPPNIPRGRSEHA